MSLLWKEIRGNPLLWLLVFAAGAFTRTTTAGQLVTSLDAAAPLHARAYLAESPWNALHTAGVACDEGRERYWLTTHVTIGYGDLVPMTLLTRTLAILIGISGILVTALVAAVAVKALNVAPPGDGEH